MGELNQSEKSGDNPENDPRENLNRTELMDRLRELGEPVETKLSGPLFQFLKNAFSINYERAFLLFEKDGVIAKAIESNRPNSPRSFSFDCEQTIETVTSLAEEGYRLVGTYHHHLDSDNEIADRTRPNRYDERYRTPMPASYDPIHLSPDDRGIFKNLTFSLADGEKSEVQAIQASIKYLFLGHQSPDRGYRIKCYSVLDQLPKDHPWNQYRQALQANGFILEHYYQNINDVLDHPIEFQSTEDIDVEVGAILDKYRVMNRKFERNFANDTFGSGTIRIFTNNKGISIVEILTDDQARRYLYDTNGNLEQLVIYGDNTTRSLGLQINAIKENLLAEQIKLEQAFGSLFDSLELDNRD